MITRLLIANRGEVVCRVAETARRLGIETVGVYSDIDENAMHVDVVDVAVRLGGAAPAESYLRGDAVIEAALRSGADAIHPGYGFLAESAEFASAVITAGLTWVGPRPEQIRLLGDKIQAKAAAEKAGVPTSPLIVAEPGTAPAGLSMPVLVKAAAGGGGRGMRIVRQHIDVPAAIEEASREAEAAFGDGSVFIEPYVERGRHIEVQILADSHGNVVHLGERDCSIQRRYQKVIEESPAPNLSKALRSKLHDAAVALTRTVGYESAGTVEFMVGNDGSISFLEVNTRLQVEHPVTEMVTGLDLVEAQIRIAEGERLPFDQSDIDIDGHAIEVRIVAEDPAAGWLPDTGTIERFDLGTSARVDSGVRGGSEVSPHYDSLLAKVIAYAPTRDEAAMRLGRTLRAANIAGVRTNQQTLAAIAAEPDFRAGKVSTKYFDEHPAVLAPLLPTGDYAALVFGATLALEAAQRDGTVTRFAPSGWRNLRTQGQRRTWCHRAEHVFVEYVMVGDTLDAKLGKWPLPDENGELPADERQTHAVRILRRVLDADGNGEIALAVDDVRTVVDVCVTDTTVHASSAAGSMSLDIVPTFEVPDEADAGSGPHSPLPGTVLEVNVVEGDVVADGDVLVVVEAMKMEHQIVASTEARVAGVPVVVGQRVSAGELLVELVTPTTQ